MISDKCYDFAYQDFYQAAHKHYSIVWWIIVHGFRAGWLRGGGLRASKLRAGRLRASKLRVGRLREGGLKER